MVDRDRPDRDPLEPREGQQLGGELGAAPARSERRLGEPLQPRLLDIGGDDLEAADDRRQQIVEIVGDPAGEPADRLHLLRLAQRFLGALALGHLVAKPVERGAQLGGALLDAALLQRRLGLLPLGDVVGDADEAGMLAAGPPSRLRDGADPAPFAVVAAVAGLERERFERRLAGQRFRDAVVILGMEDLRQSKLTASS